jgi:oxygen-independent coproporphyrinogen-3 oxidase
VEGVAGVGGVVAGSVYVHFPYCLVKCPYCDFVSYAVQPAQIDHVGYADAVLRELDARRATFPAQIESIFLGGGTPSLWAPEALASVIAGIRRAFTPRADMEITMEANPTSLQADKLDAWARAGVNRLSVGVQSLQPGSLQFLGREHSAEEALTTLRAAVEHAKTGGITRVSADLIFGLPGQTPQEPLGMVDTLLGLGLRHLSCYQLTIESGTRFGELAKAGRLPLADDARVVEAFLALDEHLTGRGLRHYEISNYAIAGNESLHNLSYWKGRPYLGLGCAAVGCLPARGDAEARRYRNVTLPERYVRATQGLPRGGSVSQHERNEALTAVELEQEGLSPETRLRERIMLGLRLDQGFDVDAARRELGVEPRTAARERTLRTLVGRGRIVDEGARWVVPKPAWLFTDDTAARLF